MQAPLSFVDLLPVSDAPFYLTYRQNKLSCIRMFSNRIYLSRKTEGSYFHYSKHGEAVFAGLTFLYNTLSPEEVPRPIVEIRYTDSTAFPASSCVGLYCEVFFARQQTDLPESAKASEDTDSPIVQHFVHCPLEDLEAAILGVQQTALLLPALRTFATSE